MHHPIHNPFIAGTASSCQLQSVLLSKPDIVLLSKPDGRSEGASPLDPKASLGYLSIGERLL